MEFKFEGVERVTARIEKMSNTLETFALLDMPQQLTRWQTDDMHRHFPNTESPDITETSTTIWPRSRTYAQMHPHVKRPRARTHQPRALSTMPRLKGAPRPTAGTHRPILRPELFQKLREDYAALMADKIKW